MSMDQPDVKFPHQSIWTFGAVVRMVLLSCAAVVIMPSVPSLNTALNAADAPVAPTDARKSTFTEVLATPAVLDQVRAGGYTLYMRHGYTDNTKADRVPKVDLEDCSTQRPLNEEGRLLAARVGDAVRTAQLPIHEIHSSPLCRAKQTTEAAFPQRTYTIDLNLMYTANLTSEEKKPIIANTRRLLSSPVTTKISDHGASQTPGNRLVVAHAPNLMDLIGYFPKEGTIVIFKPVSWNDFQYVASIPPGHWDTLMTQAGHR
jgi:phosphohistidine phosphatase SixA